MRKEGFSAERIQTSRPICLIDRLFVHFAKLTASNIMQKKVKNEHQIKVMVREKKNKIQHETNDQIIPLFVNTREVYSPRISPRCFKLCTKSK